MMRGPWRQVMKHNAGQKLVSDVMQGEPHPSLPQIGEGAVSGRPINFVLLTTVPSPTWGGLGWGWLNYGTSVSQ